MWLFKKKINDLETKGDTHVFLGEDMITIILPMEKKSIASLRENLMKNKPEDLEVKFTWSKK